MFQASCAEPAGMTKYLTLEGGSVRTLLKYVSILVLGVALGAGSRLQGCGIHTRDFRQELLHFEHEFEHAL